MNGDEKVLLNQDLNKRLYRLENAGEADDIVSQMKRRSPQVSIQVKAMGENTFLLVNKDGASANFPNSEKVKFHVPVYTSRKTGFTYFFDGVIILRPKKGLDIHEILNKETSIRLVKRLSGGTHFCSVEDGEKVLTVANRIYESGLVDFCYPNYLPPIVKNQIPTDAHYHHQYYLNNTGQSGGTSGIDIKAHGAWTKTLGCTMRVAVIDDGVEDHDDIAGRVLNGYTPINPATGNGRPAAVCRLRNPGPPATFDRVGHGMNCAGIIAASHNAFGVAGVAPNSQIYPINIFTGAEMVAHIIDGINKAWDPAYGDADIISNSWGYNTTAEVDAGITAEIIDARTYGRVRGGIARGCVVVFASGNHHAVFSGVAFPANVSGVISVGAVDHNGNIHGYSSRGGDLKLVAPSGGASGTANIDGCLIPSGGNIWTTDRPGTNGYAAGDYFEGFNGTSAAAPQVAGIAALVLSINPNLNEQDVRLLLSSTARDLGTPGFDHTYGYGLVNAEKAVEQALGGVISGPNLFCTTASYSLSGTPPGAVIWSATGNVSMNSSTGAATSLGDGPGTVRANITTGCGTITLAKEVHVGAPYYGYIIADAGWIGSGYGRVMAPSGVTDMEADYTGPGTIFEFDWQIPDHSNWDVTYRSTRSIELDYWHSPTPSSQQIYIRARNNCGWGQYLPTTWTFSTLFARYTIAPNPASDRVTLLFEKLVDAKGIPEYLELLHESSTIPVRTLKVAESDFEVIKKRDNKLSLEVGDLPRGTYFLHVSYGGRKEPNVHRVQLK